MDTTVEYLSPEKHKDLEAELNNLKTVERKKIAEHLDYAKSLGDLSENAEYSEARDKQAEIEDRISQIETILKNAVIIKKRSHSIVEIGSTVIIKKDGGAETVYIIVGSEEADMTTGKISHQSPIGNALLGHKKDDSVLIQTPRGEVTYKIIEVK